MVCFQPVDRTRKAERPPLINGITSHTPAQRPPPFVCHNFDTDSVISDDARPLRVAYPSPAGRTIVAREFTPWNVCLFFPPEGRTNVPSDRARARTLSHPFTSSNPLHADTMAIKISSAQAGVYYFTYNVLKNPDPRRGDAP